MSSSRIASRDRASAVRVGRPPDSPIAVRSRLADTAHGWRRDRVILGLAYALCWGALLVNRGLYWDDWTLSGQSPAGLLHQFSQLGMPWDGYFYVALFALPLPGLVGHVLTFSAYLGSTLVLHAILGRVPGLSRMDALVGALTFAVLPVNYARIAVIDLSYGISLLAFLVATWLLIRYVEVGGTARRVAALVLYVVAFFTASLLVLYAVPIVLAGVLIRRSSRAPLQAIALHHAEFLALPIAYWVVKAILFPPSGVYAGYNALSVSGLLQVPRALLAIPGEVLGEPLYRALTVAGLTGVVIGVAVAAWLLRRSRVREDGWVVPAPTLAVIGVAMIAMGVFGYLAVGRIPTIWDWSSRHQLLVPLGVGLLAAAAVRGARRASRVGFVFAGVTGMLLGVSAVADVSTLVAYQLDWFKQTALMAAARTTPAIATARHIRVVDTATSLDALDRTYRFYEYNALFSEAIGGTQRLVSDGSNEPLPTQLGQFIALPAYHMGGYVASPVDLELRVSPGDTPDPLDVLHLVVSEAAGSPGFEADVGRLIEVRAVPLNQPSVVP